MTKRALTKAKSHKIPADVDVNSHDVAVDVSNPGFWTNDLEVAHDHILEQSAQPDFIQTWLNKRNGRQIDVLRRNIGLDGAQSRRFKEKKDELRPDSDELLPYVLVQEFAKFKSKLATIEVAQDLLPEDVLDLCIKGGDEDFDTLALCFAIFHFKPQELRRVLHVDKIHKTGFARMKMKGGPRRPARPLADFLKRDDLEKILSHFDKSKKDGRTSELKNILHDGDHDMVFIRRCERPSLILQGQTILHGYRPEWIVLMFFDGAKRVNISSVSVDASLEIANRIASEYYGAACEYENESEITYAKQIERLINLLKVDGDEQLTWVELVMGSSPLDGECPIKLSDRTSHSIGRAVQHFENCIGSLSANIDSIESIKVLYAKKRISLIFDKQQGADDEFVVRYSDNRLNPKQRRAFEAYMRTVHAIPVLSTEKRFKHPA